MSYFSITSACEIVLQLLSAKPNVFLYYTDFPLCHIPHSSPLISAGGSHSVSKTLLSNSTKWGKEPNHVTVRRNDNWQDALFKKKKKGY